MRFKLELEAKLGQAVVAELTRLVSTGAIRRREVKEMSYEHHMNVNTVYNQGQEDKQEDIQLTLERMLDRWYELSVCSLSASAAQSKLLEILEGSGCSNLAVHTIRDLCQAVGGGGGEERGSFRGNNIAIDTSVRFK